MSLGNSGEFSVTSRRDGKFSRFFLPFSRIRRDFFRRGHSGITPILLPSTPKARRHNNNQGEYV